MKKYVLYVLKHDEKIQCCRKSAGKDVVIPLEIVRQRFVKRPISLRMLPVNLFSLDRSDSQPMLSAFVGDKFSQGGILTNRRRECSIHTIGIDVHLRQADGRN